MRIYFSAGGSTIAALMAVDRETGGGWSAEDSDGASGRVIHATRRIEDISRPCEQAVISAYIGLRAHGMDALPALRACTTLYNVHHPEASPSAAGRFVAQWIDHHIIRGDEGPTLGCDCD